MVCSRVSQFSFGFETWTRPPTAAISGVGEARDQLAQRASGTTITSESTETMISASRLAHGVVDALALAHVVRVAQHADVAGTRAAALQAHS